MKENCPVIRIDIDKDSMRKRISQLRTVMDLIDWLLPYSHCDLDLQGTYRTFILPVEDGKDVLVVLPLKNINGEYI